MVVSRNEVEFKSLIVGIYTDEHQATQMNDSADMSINKYRLNQTISRITLDYLHRQGLVSIPSRLFGKIVLLSTPKVNGWKLINSSEILELDVRSWK